jgi:hypothetical protein
MDQAEGEGSDVGVIKLSEFARWRVEIGCADKFRALLEVIGTTSVRRESVPPVFNACFDLFPSLVFLPCFTHCSAGGRRLPASR